MAEMCKILIMEYSIEFPQFAKIAAFALAIPVSSVPCERGFSAQKRIQSRLRSSLLPEKVDNLMKVSLLGPPINKFNIDYALNIFNTKERKNYSF